MEQIKSQIFAFLQKLGQALMIPVSVLPAAGLVVALGRMLQQTDQDNLIAQSLGKVFYSGGLAVFEQLSVIFAIGVAIGFTSGAGIAGLSAAAAYFTLTSLLKVMVEVRGLEMQINAGVFGGIIIGGMTAWLYNKYHQIELPKVFGFFAGKRFIPILSVGATLFVGIILAYIWPPVQTAIAHFGEMVNASDFGAAFYAAGKRLLIPVGLHHVYYPSFLYEFGSFTDAAGKIFRGDSTRYFAGDSSAGVFMASEFPIMIFGLPMAALAMVLRAKIEKRKAIFGIMLSAALTSIITGITEPIEFAFIFVAPLLFVVHVLLAFLSGFLTTLFDIHLGYSFSASLIDFATGYFNQKNSMYLWLIVGPIIGALYFVSFYFLIGWLDFKTPGRTKDDDAEVDATLQASVPGAGHITEKAGKILEALGGQKNIKSIDACITRLRLLLVDTAQMNKGALTKLGASGVLNAGGGNVQVIFGTQSDRLKEEIRKIIAQNGTTEGQVIKSPIQGKTLNLDLVPDEVFSQRIIGEGFAIEPSEGRVFAPLAASVVHVFPTGHAIGLKAGDVEYLIHVGIDTVKMQGEGFKSHVKAGDQVRAGDLLIEFDIDKIKAAGKSTISPFVVTNTSELPGRVSVVAQDSNLVILLKN